MFLPMNSNIIVKIVACKTSSDCGAGTFLSGACSTGTDSSDVTTCASKIQKNRHVENKADILLNSYLTIIYWKML